MSDQERDRDAVESNLRTRCAELNEACAAKQLLIDHTADDLRGMHDLFVGACTAIGKYRTRVAELEATLQSVLDALRWEEELRSHVLTHDGDCLIHKARAVLSNAGEEAGK